VQRVFIEAKEFTQQWAALGYTIEELWEVQDYLSQNPEIGDMIRETGGLRKIRWQKSTGRGKSGGSRVIYVDFASDEETWLITVFGKNEKANLSKAEKKAFKTLIQNIKRE